MKYEELSNLNQNQLIEGIEKLYKNAINLHEISMNLSNQKQFGLGIALSVLSIEELIKSYSLFLYIVGVVDKELFDAAFNTKNLHKSRLKTAHHLNTSHELIDKYKTIETIGKAAQTIDFDFGNMSPLEILKMDWIGDFMDKFDQSEEIKAELKKINEEIVPEAESINKLAEHTSWFVHAQKSKEKGLYCDLTNNSWESPSDSRVEEFEIAKYHSDSLFKSIGKPIDTLISSPDYLREIFLNITKQSIESTRKKA
ncbi:AbiV family abortive infection protein [Fulvivirga sp.]|uniref:AbiV family abortive infection protein n=1 Tax=Fulvivirga sp. TaxID=1931237 RepID=UPI0032EF1E71